MKQIKTKVARQRANEKNQSKALTVSYRVKRLFPRPVKSAHEAYRIAHRLWSKELRVLQEQVMVLYLDADKYVIGYRFLNTGTMVASVVDLKLMVCIGVRLMATGVIVLHNHPSDHARPSSADKSATQRIQIGLLFFDILLIDHLILSKTGYYSFAEKGKLR